MKLGAHAYVVKGGGEAVHDVLTLLKKEGIEPEGNPDVYVRAYSSFLMEDARSLRDRASMRAVKEEGRFFIIAAPTISPDAQNALLKTFEEPPAGATFILIVSSPETLLPTLLSRMQTLDLPKQKITTSDVVKNNDVGRRYIDTSSFLAATPEKRIEMLKPLLEKDEDDQSQIAGAGRREGGGRHLSEVLAFLKELEGALGKNPRHNAVGLQAVYRARKYITDRGSLKKPLLEQAALLIPKML